MKTTYIDLLTTGGEIVRIEVSTQFEDECWESIEHAMKSRGWWSPNQWDKCVATYLGNRVNRVNMGLIVATL